MLACSLTILFAFATSLDAEADPVLGTTKHFFKHQDIEVTEIRTLDRGTELIHREAFDATGASVDLDALRMREQELKIAARGKMSPELGARVAQAAADDSLQVAFWLATENEPDCTLASTCGGLGPRVVAADSGRPLASIAPDNPSERALLATRRR